MSGGAVFSPTFILSNNCIDSEWIYLDQYHISDCLTNKENTVVFPKSDHHCSKKMGVGRETRSIPLASRMSRLVVINGEHMRAKAKYGGISLLVAPTVKKIKFIYDCSGI